MLSTDAHQSAPISAKAKEKGSGILRLAIGPGLYATRKAGYGNAPLYSELYCRVIYVPNPPQMPGYAVACFLYMSNFSYKW